MFKVASLIFDQLLLEMIDVHMEFLPRTALAIKLALKGMIQAGTFDDYTDWLDGVFEIDSSY